MMNLGKATLTESPVPISKDYGEIQGINVRFATEGSIVELVDAQLRLQLPPFGFVLG